MEPGKSHEGFADLGPHASTRPTRVCWPSLDSLRTAIQGTENWLLDRQDPDGFWCGELQGDTILESETILLLAWLGEADTPFAAGCAAYLVEHQLPEGGWGLFPGAEADVSVSVKAYFALKLTGHAPDTETMRRARHAILKLGGADRVNSFTRFFLALLGQIPYDVCPAVPPEAVLLPTWFPINIYRISAWSRTILVPLSIVWAHRPCREIPKELGISELITEDPRHWPPTGAPGNATWRSSLWRNLFLGLDHGLKFLEGNQWTPLRRRALDRAATWMTERFRDSDGLGAIYPPIVWSWIALKCLGYDDDTPHVRDCRVQLEQLLIEEAGTIRLQPCKSPVWDTAITLRSLASTSPPERIQTARERAIDWLLDKEVREGGDWCQTVRSNPAGWFFEHRNAFYPDTDDTAMVLLAFRDEVTPAGGLENHAACSTQWMIESTFQNRGEATRGIQRLIQVTDACQRGIKWLKAMQNRDGGWGAFDKDNDAEFLCYVPFADHNAMIDPSTPDLTGRVVESLAAWGLPRKDRAMRRAIHYLLRTQEPDGSWFGRWGVNYIYGTWQVLVGLAAADTPPSDRIMRQAAEWLLSRQQAHGGWGESADSYADPSLKGHGPATASQTAWALLGLMAAGYVAAPAVRRGIQYLLDTQQPDGSWHELEFTGTGFPQVFYLRYHYYRIYFPLMALRQWQTLTHEIR